jgi:hypothetical protein
MCAFVGGREEVESSAPAHGVVWAPDQSPGLLCMMPPSAKIVVAVM